MMKKTVPSAVLCGSLVLLLAVSGCASSRFYRVTDPASGKAYYTPKVVRDKKSGSVTFLDPASGLQMTLVKPEVKTINRKQFNDGLHKK